MITKRMITLLSFVCVLALTLSIPSTLVAKGNNAEYENSGNGCKLQGTWIAQWSQYGIKYFITFIGAGANEGTVILEWIGDVAPGGLSISGARGVFGVSGNGTHLDKTLREAFSW